VSAGVISRYAEWLPIGDATPRISLGEGATPCVPSRVMAQQLGLGSLHFKLEGLNPTGSFKDRGMVVAVAKALEDGSRAIVCASTGNTSASAAAYAARAGVRAGVVVPAGGIASGKLLQAQVHGATVLSVRGGFDAALRLVRELSDHYPVTLVNSVNPHRIEGQKTAAFEIVDELGDAPDVLAIPVGNAGNITACWAGFRDYRAAGVVDGLPRMFGFQAAGAAPLVRGAPIDEPETVATAIRIGNPASWASAIAARDESGGRIDAVTDDEILAAYRDLARVEGIFCEPASAASVAGIRAVAARGELDRNALVVCVLTGAGLKDRDTATSLAPGILEAKASPDGVVAALGW